MLTHVLAYDDLLMGCAGAVALPDVPEILIGRSAAQQSFSVRDGLIGIYDNWVSGRHATITRNGRDASGPIDLVADEGSRNGTFVGGQPLRTRRRLRDGDLVEVGHTLLCYRVVDEPIVESVTAGEPVVMGPTSTRCPEVITLVQMLCKLAPSREPLMILGETGTGKEVAALFTHTQSARSGPCVAVDCGAIPDTLFEATFFGHRRGAFTGADHAREGEIARANGGSLFLDELANLSPLAQAKLLRAIEDGRVTPLGSAEPQLVDVRWISATNSRSIDEEGAFRADLFSRLSSFVVHLPPLRSRREDLGTLSAHLLRTAGMTRASITAPAGRALYNDSFPRNIRQLRATLRSAAILAGDDPIDLRHLRAEPLSIKEDAPTDVPRTTAASGTDKGAVHLALSDEYGNVVRAASRLGIHPRQLYRLIERWGLSLESYRGANH